jgi:NADPH:quinone reductase-like Zn-dependent oxidoreductase
MPESVPFAESATLPHDLLTVHYLLYEALSICQDDVVLIHGGHTRVAKLLINHITERGCKILVTVPTMSDKNTLQKLFSGINTCIGRSSDCFLAGCATVVADLPVRQTLRNAFRLSVE